MASFMDIRHIDSGRDKGRLCVLWDDTQARPDERHIAGKVYDEIFRPALQTDILHLYEAHKAGPAVAYTEYHTVLAQMKLNIGIMAIPTMYEVADDFETFHQNYMKDPSPFLDHAAYALLSRYRKTNLDRMHIKYLETRTYCVGFDTHHAIRHMAQIIASGPGSEQLSWTETMEGPEAVKKLLTETWPDRRRTVDIESLIPRLMPLAVEEEALQRGHDAEHRYNLRAARSADEVRRRRTALHVVKPAAQMNPSHA